MFNLTVCMNFRNFLYIKNTMFLHTELAGYYGDLYGKIKITNKIIHALYLELT